MDDVVDLFNCDECGTAWDTEGQAWECSHDDRMAAADAL